MTARSPRLNPFLRHALAGWAPEHPQVRFPATFSVTEEGPNRALYLSPVGLEVLHAALDLPAADAALVRGDAGAAEIAWGELPHGDDDIEVVHLGASPAPEASGVDVPEPLLADPSAAVATGRGGRVALSLSDGCHGVVLSPDPELLARCLAGFLTSYVEAVVGPEIGLPPLTRDLLAPLIAPRPAGETCTATLALRARYWRLDLDWVDPAGEATDTERWVCEGPGGRWRAGWSW